MLNCKSIDLLNTIILFKIKNNNKTNSKQK